jgi:hypothetical protein
MKLPENVTFDESMGLMTWRPRGIIDEAAVDRIVAFIDFHEIGSDLTFNRFTDTLSADMVDLNFQFIFRVSLYRRLAYKGPPVKSAILVNSSQIAQYWKLHAMLTQGSPLNVRIFTDREGPATWLGVPVARLSPTEK